MLCPSCTHYTWHTVAGSCENCQSPTANYHQRICDKCSNTLDECEICRTNMGTKSASSTKGTPSGWVIKKAVKDNGGKVTLKVGDELEVCLDESRNKEYYTGYAHDSSVVGETNRGDFVQGQNYSQGYRTFKFKAKAAGTTTLELEEWNMRWQYSYYGSSSGYTKDTKTGNTWKLTITVK